MIAGKSDIEVAKCKLLLLKQSTAALDQSQLGLRRLAGGSVG